MSTFIDLDSIWRDRLTYPNPAFYEVTPDQVNTWFASARSIRATPQNNNTRPLEFATDVSLQVLTLPYNSTLVTYPRIYLDFHSKLYNDRFLISTINGVNPEARFICVLDKIQYDSNNNPIWMHYRSTMKQTLRFKRDDSVVFAITTRDGSILPFFIDNNTDLPIDPTQQTLATFELIPYIRDAKYVNNMIEPVNSTK
jgi:hypothetical protein